VARILLIDDSAVARRISRHELEADGHEILEANGGAAGLELIQSNIPDLIVLDLLMPGEKGTSVLEKLHVGHPSIPVIILTADVQQQTREECLKLGAKAVTNKFRDAGEFRRIVREVLDALQRD
jgi:twitching motility two-component system response regulator PilH